MNDDKRIQTIDRKLTQLASVVTNPTIAQAQPSFGSNLRLAKVVTTGTHPTTGQTFEIEFCNCEFIKAGGNVPGYTKRSSVIKWCCNLVDFLPDVGDNLIVWYDNGRWWTDSASAGGGGVIVPSGTTIYEYEVDDTTTEVYFRLILGGLNNTAEVGRAPGFSDPEQDQLQSFAVITTNAPAATSANIAVRVFQTTGTASQLDFRVGITNDQTNFVPFIGDFMSSLPASITPEFTFLSDDTIETVYNFDVTSHIVPIINANAGAVTLFFQIWLRPTAPLIDNKAHSTTTTLTIIN